MRMKLCELCNHNENGVCNICGCILELKTRSMSSTCALEEIKQKPLWRSKDETKF